MRAAAFSYDSFQAWQAETSALLVFDPILRLQFISAAKEIVRVGDFPAENNREHPREMRRIIEIAMADLRVRSAEDLHTGASSEISSIATSGASIPLPTTARSPKAWTSGDPLGAENGPLWFWHHCHYRVRWSLVAWAAGASLTVLTAGFAAGRTNLVIRLFDVFHDTSATAPTHQPSQEQSAPATDASSSRRLSPP